MATDLYRKSGFLFNLRYAQLRSWSWFEVSLSWPASGVGCRAVNFLSLGRRQRKGLISKNLAQPTHQ
jgi:hypothetical protein